MKHPLQEQPAPRGHGTIVGRVVLSDVRARIRKGKEKYRTELRTNNGRDMLWDLYFELLDAVFYLRGALLEKEGK